VGKGIIGIKIPYVGKPKAEEYFDLSHFTNPWDPWYIEIRDWIVHSGS
jgi:hypothetical protein